MSNHHHHHQPRKDVNEVVPRWSWFQWLAVVGLAIAVPALGFALSSFVLTFVFNGQNIKTLTGVPPKAGGEVTGIAGAGISIVPDIPASELTIVNTGVLSNVAGTGISVSAATGDVTVTNTGVVSLVAGPAVSVSAATGTVTVSNTGVRSAIAGTGVGVSGATGDVTFSNTGVTSVAVGSGISTSAATGGITLANTGVLSVTATDGLATDITTGAVTASHVITTQTLLGYGDANGPQVSYLNVIGVFTPVPENTWQNSIGAAFVAGFFPGIMPGDGGQGDAAGTMWSVPASGQYSVDVSCDVFPSAIDVETHQSVSVALAFNANDVDPFLFGYIPIGGYQTIDLNTGTLAGSGPAVNRRISFTTSFHACASCPVVVGDVMTVHARMDHSSTGAIVAVTLDAFCSIQVSRQI